MDAGHGAENAQPDAPLRVSAGNYAVSLPAFDGPLDLLLHLIVREELDIFDIPIARLTRAYLDALVDLRALEIESAGEFLVMAATLLQIKSRLLLPRPAAVDDLLGDEEEDPRAELVRRLLLYQQFRDAAGGLDARPRVGRDAFTRPPGLDRPPPDDEDPLGPQDVWRLAEAFAALLSRRKFEAPHDIYVERISIGERIAQIADRLAATGRVTLGALCEGARYREEVITTFLAVLEMARLRLIRVTQGERAGPIYVEARVGAIGDLGEEAAGMLTDEAVSALAQVDDDEWANEEANEGAAGTALDGDAAGAPAKASDRLGERALVQRVPEDDAEPEDDLDWLDALDDLDDPVR